jgi:predicted flap endonuclease-1-like 5' DNA nuclease
VFNRYQTGHHHRENGYTGFNIDEIKGVGPVYAEKPGSAGIFTTVGHSPG